MPVGGPSVGAPGGHGRPALHAVLRFSRFGMVGVLNTLVDLCVFGVLFYAAGAPLLLANSCAYALAALNSYCVNKAWTFRDSSRGGESLRAAVAFAFVTLTGIAIANLAIWMFARHMPVAAAKPLSIGVTIIWNYWGCARLVYRRATR